MVVGVGLAVGNGIELVERLAPAGGVDAEQQLVLRRIVAVGLRERDAVLGMVGDAVAIAVGLHLLVAAAVLARRRGADPRQHAALRIARHDVRADRLLQHAEVMAMVQHAGLHAVPLLAVGRLRLAPDVIVDARGRHQVAFVGGVDEHPPGVALPAEHRDRGDAPAGLCHALGAVEPLVAVDADLMLLDEILEHALRHVRLEDPHRPLRAIDRRRPLPFVAVLLALLPGPRTRLVVVLPDAVIELAREAADDRLVAGVGEAEPAAREPAEMLVRTDDDDASCPGAWPGPPRSRRRRCRRRRRGRTRGRVGWRPENDRTAMRTRTVRIMVQGSGFRFRVQGSVQGSRRSTSDRTGPSMRAWLRRTRTRTRPAWPRGR